MSVQIQLDKPHAHFTNLDFITGRVVLSTLSHETISAIVVKLEGESRTCLTDSQLPQVDYRGRNVVVPRGREQVESEIHMVLYKVSYVFPSAELRRAAGENPSYTLAAGKYEYPFEFKIPLNNDCTRHVYSGNILSEVVMPTNRHVKKTLPPSLDGLPRQAEICYFVKATVQRTAFYKENFRALTPFTFLPIEPPRVPATRRESYARREHQFAPKIDIPSKPGLLRQPSIPSTSPTEAPPKISLDGRLPDPAIINCNEPIPLRILVTKLNNSSATIYLQLLNIDLLGYTEVRAHHLMRKETSYWNIMSRSNLKMAIGSRQINETDKELEVDQQLWKQKPLPNTVAPSFQTCNITRYYELVIKVGLSYGSSDSINPELAVQMLRMPVQIYSGIAPPEALLKARMNSHPSYFQGQQQISPSQPTPPSPLPQASSSSSTGPPSQMHSPYSPPPAQPPQGHFVPPTFPGEAPPSYEDAIADGIGPVDGPRRAYDQQPSTPASASSGRGWEESAKDERLFPDSWRQNRP